MHATWRGFGSFAVVLAAAGGCQLIAGVTDPTTRMPDAGAGGSTTATGTGTGGQPTSTFAFAIKAPTVHVPYGSFNDVDVEVTPSGGFTGSVDVTVQGAPAGFTAMPLTIPAGSTTGTLHVGADTTLSIGTMFTLTLVATSGSIVKTASAPAVVTGKPGDLDQTFGDGGLVVGPNSSGYIDLNDIREVTQGKILVAGLATGKLGDGTAIGLRFLSDGTPDPAFNGTGSVSNTYCGCTKSQGGNLSVAREVDGTLLFAGWGNADAGKGHDIFLFRYDASGVLDTTVHGDNGTETVDLGGDEEVAAAELVPNSGNVVVTGTKDNQLFVARVPDRLAFGSPDQSFAAPNGWIAPALGGTSSSANGLAIDAMGRIVVTGWVTSASGDDVVVLRLTADGALDPSFASGGISILARPGNQHGSTLVIQPDGNILIAADTDEGGSPQLLVQRLLPSGAADTSFGTQGAAVVPLGGMSNANFDSHAAWMVLMPDGRIVVAGNGTLGSVSGPVFARFHPDGSLDSTFGSGGQAAVYVGLKGAVQAMTLASDGKLLIAGSNGRYPGASFIARLWN